MTLTCPKCRHGLADDALDVGHCPLCGFPLDGPVVLVPSGPRTGTTRLLIAGATALILAAAGTIFALNDWSLPQRGPTELSPETIASRSTESQPAPTSQVPQSAPFPHEAKRPDANTTNPPAPPGEPPGTGDKGPPPVPADPPKPNVGPRPVGVVMKVDPKIEPRRHFDHPNDTVALPDLNTGDRVTLTGKVRVLKLGSVNGKGIADASGLVAEEVVITGDLNNEARVLVNAPNGTVTVGGYVTGASKLTITAPGGTVTVEGSGRLSGGTLMAVTARRLAVKCPMSGNARANVTLTAGGTLKLGLMEDGATVAYKKAAPNDPPPTVERGVIRGGARVVPVN